MSRVGSIVFGPKENEANLSSESIENIKQLIREYKEKRDGNKKTKKIRQKPIKSMAKFKRLPPVRVNIKKLITKVTSKRQKKRK